MRNGIYFPIYGEVFPIGGEQRLILFLMMFLLIESKNPSRLPAMTTHLD